MIQNKNSGRVDLEKSIHHFAAEGFQAESEAYERGRPEYPTDAVDHLIRELKITSQSVVVDLGAGTGKLTKMLTQRGVNVIAIEPVEGMRKKLKQVLPDIEMIDGTAEKIPLQSESVDAVVVAQAFHWFDGDKAIPEIHRILKPNGKLGLIWNARDETTPWVAQLSEILDEYENGAPRYKSGNWKKAFDQMKLFKPFQENHFKYLQQGDLNLILDRVGSISFIASLPSDEKNHVLQRISELVKKEMYQSKSSIVTLPYRTDVYVSEK